MTLRTRLRRAVLGGSIFAFLFNIGVSSSFAGVASDMTGFFNDMGASANVTGPTAFQGQSAGYYSLGSVWTRFPQKTAYPANLQLPKVRAGCGGIDIFTGSFSFINASEMVAMMKAIANNAIGFAFKLAIDAISPQIGGVMDRMQEIADKINQFNMNSCEQSAAIVGGLAGEMGIKNGQVCQAVGTSKGVFSDWARARQGCGADGQRTSTLRGADAAEKAQMIGPKNYAWDMINASPLKDNSQEMREMVMTLLGTIIIPDRVNDDAQPNIQYLGAEIGPVLDALLDGNTSVNIISCVDATKCLTTGKRTVPALGVNAMRPRARTLILSMSQKALNDAQLTTEEQSLLSVASVPLYKIIAVQAASGLRLSETEVDSLAEITAIDLLNSVVTQVLDQVSATRGGLMSAGDAREADKFMDQVHEVRERIALRDSKVENRVNRTIDIINNAMRIESTLQSRMAPGMSAALAFSRGLAARGMR